jgi:hypothetical protein
VNCFARTLARLAGTRLSRFASASMLSVLVALTFAAPSGAVVKTVGETTVGLQPRSGAVPVPSAGFSNNEGNAVVHGASIYAVYWDPGAWLHHEWVTNVDGFLQDLGASSGEPNTIFAALGQYRDRSNTPATDQFVYKGSYSDTTPYPEEKCTDPEPLALGQLTCLTDAQVREQLQSFIAIHGTEKGMHSIYYVLTPPGVAVCLDEASTHCSDYSLTEEELEKGVRNSASYNDSFCSYHGAINPDKATEGDGNTILYATVPWSAGYEGHPWDFWPGNSMAGQAYDCQDGGYYPSEGGTKHEHAKELGKVEKEHFEQATPEEKEKELAARRLEGPHIEEPNQNPEVKEEGDFASGLSDVLINQIAVEQANIVTDPMLTSWQTGTGLEATDECRDRFGSFVAPSAIEGSVTANPQTEAGTLSNVVMNGHHYYINNVLNLGELHSAQCVGGVALVPRFTSPNPVNSGELVDFDGMESTVGEAKGVVFGAGGVPSTTYATFAWNFGDGSEVKGYAPGAPICEAPWLSPCAASAFHAYQYGGEYTVTLTITDVAGNVATISHPVTVVGPPPSSASSAGGGGSGATSGTGKSPGSGTPPAPVAAAQILSRSARSAAHKGLVVGYSVNEQVAGHFEVLLSRSQAQSLHIGGALATGLPAGTPAQIVIAKAILVTTRGGHSTIDIRFSKAVAAKLAKARKLAVMVRLIVKSAASSNPAATTTVVNDVTLPR